MAKQNHNPGDKCPNDTCNGILIEQEAENCSCHINPPCSECTDAGLICDKCGDEFFMNIKKRF